MIYVKIKGANHGSHTYAVNEFVTLIIRNVFPVDLKGGYNEKELLEFNVDFSDRYQRIIVFSHSFQKE